MVCCPFRMAHGVLCAKCNFRTVQHLTPPPLRRHTHRWRGGFNPPLKSACLRRGEATWGLIVFHNLLTWHTSNTSSTCIKASENGHHAKQNVQLKWSKKKSFNTHTHTQPCARAGLVISWGRCFPRNNKNHLHQLCTHTHLHSRRNVFGVDI